MSTFNVFETEDTAAAEAVAIDTLARTVWGEARKESVRGKEAVAATVVNRLPESRFVEPRERSNAIVEICLSPFAFNCWQETGTKRSELLKVDENNREFAICVRVARRAVRGALQDPSGGATCFHHVHAHPSWAKGLIPCKVVGMNKFYRVEQASHRTKQDHEA